MLNINQTSNINQINNVNGKQVNFVVANTSTHDLLLPTNKGSLLENSVTVCANKKDEGDEDNTVTLLATDAKGNPARLTYVIQQGNGLDTENDDTREIISLRIDNDTIDTTLAYYRIDKESKSVKQGALRVNTTKLVDDKTIKSVLDETTDTYHTYVNPGELIESDTETQTLTTFNINDEEHDRLKVVTRNLDKASASTYGVVKCDNNSIKSNKGTLSVDPTAFSSTLEVSSTSAFGSITYNTTYNKLEVITGNLDWASLNTAGVAKLSDQIYLSEEGKLITNTAYMNLATPSTPGVVKYDGITIQMTNTKKLSDYIVREKDKLISGTYFMDAEQIVRSDIELYTYSSVLLDKSEAIQDTIHTAIVKENITETDQSDETPIENQGNTTGKITLPDNVHILNQEPVSTMPLTGNVFNGKNMISAGESSKYNMRTSDVIVNKFITNGTIDKDLNNGVNVIGTSINQDLVVDALTYGTYISTAVDLNKLIELNLSLFDGNEPGTLFVNTRNLEPAISSKVQYILSKDGILTKQIKANGKLGVVYPDGDTILCDDSGCISVNTGNLVHASATNYGVVKIDNSTIVKDSDGSIKVGQLATVNQSIENILSTIASQEAQISRLSNEIIELRKYINGVTVTATFTCYYNGQTNPSVISVSTDPISALGALSANNKFLYQSRFFDIGGFRVSCQDAGRANTTPFYFKWDNNNVDWINTMYLRTNTGTDFSAEEEVNNVTGISTIRLGLADNNTITARQGTVSVDFYTLEDYPLYHLEIIVLQPAPISATTEAPTTSPYVVIDKTDTIESQEINITNTPLVINSAPTQTNTRIIGGANSMVVTSGSKATII